MVVKSVVVYASHKGNTKTIAERVAASLRERGDVSVFEVDDAPDLLPEADLVLIGGPTEARSMTPAMVAFLDRMLPSSVFGKAVAAFDTRLAWPRMLSGSAAVDIASRLEAAGADVAAPPESFMVTSEPRLKPGELERASEWALRVADSVDSHEPVIAAG